MLTFMWWKGISSYDFWVTSPGPISVQKQESTNSSSIPIQHSHTAMIVSLRTQCRVLQWEGDVVSCKQTVFTVHAARRISRGTRQRPMRQPDELVLFFCARWVALHCLSRDSHFNTNSLMSPGVNLRCTF